MENSNTTYTLWGFLPDEVLINLFLVTDPLHFDQYRSVCKKWAALLHENELWKRFCHLRWSTNPTKATNDNKLMPVDTLRGEIMWRDIYWMRDLAEKMTDALFDFVAINGVDDIIEPAPKEDFFASGWISIEGAKALSDNIDQGLDSIRTLPEGSECLAQVEVILDFVLRLELIMAKYTADYFFSEVNLLSGFLSWNYYLIQFVSPDNRLQLRIAKFEHRIIKYLLDSSSNCVKLLNSELATAMPASEDLIREQFKSYIYCMQNSKVDEDSWILSPGVESPTSDIEGSFNGHCCRIAAQSMLTMKVLDELLSHVDVTTRRGRWTVMALIGRFQYEPALQDNLDYIMHKFVLPYFTVTNDPYIAVPMFCYYKSLFLDTNLDFREYVDPIMKVVLGMVEMKHPTVRTYCCEFISTLIRFFAKVPELLKPHANELFAKLTLLWNEPSAEVRTNSVYSAARLVMTLRELFSDKRDVLFAHLSNMASSDNKTSTELFFKLGGKFKDPKFVQIIDPMYRRLLETYTEKKSQDNVVFLLKMTPHCIDALQGSFEKYFLEMYPLLIHYIGTQSVPHPQSTEDEIDAVVELKIYAFKSMSRILQTFSKDYLTAYYAQIKQTAASNFNDNYAVLCPLAKLFSQLTERFFEVNMASNWTKQIPGMIVECCELFLLAIQSNPFWHIRLKVIREFNKIIFHLTQVSSDPALTPEVINVVCETIVNFTNFYQKQDYFDDSLGFAEEVITLFKFVISNAANKESVMLDIVPPFETIVSHFKKNGSDEIQWLDVSIVIAAYNYFRDPLIHASTVLADAIYYMCCCRDSNSERIKQALAKNEQGRYIREMMMSDD